MTSSIHVSTRRAGHGAFGAARAATWMLAAVLSLGAYAATPSESPGDDRASVPALRAEAARLFGAVVKVEARAVPDARSNATLGAEREGTGVVIGADGLVLTIGYLVVEAEEVRIIDSRGGTHSAKLVGYDHPTGLALLRPVDRVDIAPVALGDSAALGEKSPVMIVNYQGTADVTLAFVVSRRPFTGSWEYALDNAIFTAPPASRWSGAGLFGSDGRLLGIGSLVVRDVIKGDATLPGNMFVPIDVLKPVLDDLVRAGRRAGPARPWLGISADEVQGRLFVTRVSPEGPAAKAGISTGDIILGVGRDGVRTQADFYRRIWASGNAGMDIPLRVLHDLDVLDVQVRSIDRTEYFSPRTMH
ncbi:MAG: S1C family serine protease [Casimicrobiaceae bacterium]